MCIYIEMLNKKFVFVNSKNRLSGDDSNFRFKIDLPKDKKFDRIVVIDASIPKSYYNVNHGAYFTLQEDTKTANISIAEGNYNRRSFQSYVLSLLNTYSPNGLIYNIVYPSSNNEPDTGKYTFSVNGNSGIQPIFIMNITLYELFGFDMNSVNSFNNNSLISKNIINFQSQDVLLLHSDLCNNNGDNILQVIYSNIASNLTNIVYECFDPVAQSRVLTTSDSSQYIFTLTDEYNTPINLNGIGLSFTLLFFTESETDNIIQNFIKYKLLKD